MAIKFTKMIGTQQLRSIPDPGYFSVGLSTAKDLYRLTFGLSGTPRTGDEFYILNTVDFNNSLDSEGNKIDTSLPFSSSTLWVTGKNKTDPTKTTRYTIGRMTNEIMNSWLSQPNKYLKIVIGVSSTNYPDYYQNTSVTVEDSLPKSIFIDNQTVKSISIGQELSDISIDGHTYTFDKDITITQDEVESFVSANTTWGGVSTTPELTIGSADYTSVVRSAPYANCIHLVDYTWPATVETKDSVLLTFTDDIDAFYTSSDHFWISKGDTFTADAIKVMSAPWPSQSFKAGETWLFSTTGVPVKVENTATIDTTIKLKELVVEYSKSTGIADNEAIDVTVKLDTAVAPTINGVAADAVFTGIVIANPARTITEKEVTDYIDANTVFTGSNGHLDVTAWPYAGTTLFTSTASITKGDDVVYEVRAESGFTINGGSVFTVTYNIPDTVAVVYVGTNNSGIKKLEGGKLVNVVDDKVGAGFMTQTFDGTIYVGTSNVLKKLEGGILVDVVNTNVVTGFMTQVSDGTIYVGTTTDGLKKLENGNFVDVDDTDVSSGFMTQTADGTIYVGLSGQGGLKKLEGGKLVDVNDIVVQNGFMTQVSDGTIYIGTNSDGIKKLVNGALVDVDSTNVNTGFMTQISDGTIYVGTTSNGLKKLVNNTLIDIDSANVLTGFMTQVSDGTVYVGTYGVGLKKIVNDKYVDVDNTDVGGGFMTEVQE